MIYKQICKNCKKEYNTFLPEPEQCLDCLVNKLKPELADRIEKKSMDKHGYGIPDNPQSDLFCDGDESGFDEQGEVD